jgi:hypothetical protein
MLQRAVPEWDRVGILVPTRTRAHALAHAAVSVGLVAEVQFDDSSQGPNVHGRPEGYWVMAGAFVAALVQAHRLDEE